MLQGRERHQSVAQGSNVFEPNGSSKLGGGESAVVSRRWAALRWATLRWNITLQMRGDSTTRNGILRDCHGSFVIVRRAMPGVLNLCQRRVGYAHPIWLCGQPDCD